jgi:hypothetical protein
LTSCIISANLAAKLADFWEVLLTNLKAEKFKELAERRVNFAIDAISRVGKLSNPHAYDYTDSDIRKIVKALRDAVNEAEARFTAPRRRGESRFTLS